MSKRRSFSEVQHQYFSQGIVYGLIPFLMLSSRIGIEFWENHTMVWGCGLLMVAMMLIANSILPANPSAGKMLFAIGLAGNVMLVMPKLITDPFWTLFYGVVVLTCVFYLATRKSIEGKGNSYSCFSGAGLALITAVLLSPVFSRSWMTDTALSISSAMVMFLYLRWKIAVKKLLQGVIAAVIFAAVLAVAWYLSLARIFLFLFAVLSIAAASFRRRPPDIHWLADIAMHPARFLALTFILLPLLGTLLLRTEFAMKNPLSVVDAAFTAVSGVCVTGLSVLDISADLTLTGQIILLVLIQLGGFGIVSIATLILHAVGRFSLNEERLARDLSPQDGQELMQSLKQVLGLSLLLEGIGSLLLWAAFLMNGEGILHSLWLGIFTSISAFCNAGFFPGSESLVPYNTSAFLLHVVALLMAAGGTAPFLAEIVMCLKNRRMISVSCKIIMITTGILLAGGTLLTLIIEWDGFLAGLSFSDKVTNAWFMSSTLRTGGFNSVPMGGVMNSLYLIMLVLMFIGGSPGGTAGGVKTSSFAVVCLTFRSAILGRKYVSYGLHRISFGNIMKAVAVIFAWVLLCIVTVILLAVTQDISFRELVFECVSAFGTVGLSVGATGKLDEIGKVIIMFAMFIGRIGPLTFFLLLNDNSRKKEPGMPEIDLPLG